MKILYYVKLLLLNLTKNNVCIREKIELKEYSSYNNVNNSNMKTMNKYTDT